MSHRVSPTDRIRHHIDELFAQDKTLPGILEEVARLGAQLLNDSRPIWTCSAGRTRMLRTQSLS